MSTVSPSATRDYRLVDVRGCGLPIGGENPPHDRRWRHQVAAAAAGHGRHRGVRLDFRVEPHCSVDLDNLVRPALAGLRDAGVFTRGYADLDTIVATKSPNDKAGLNITLVKSSELDDSNPPGPTLLDVEFFTLPRHVESRPLWQSTVAEAWQHRPALSAGVFVGVNLSTSRSLEGLLKPIIDGLTPCLGRDPWARLEFTPNDHLIQWLRFHRTSGPTLRLRLGRTM